jgi:hypothetical protein
VAQVEFTRAQCDLLSPANCRREDVPARGDIVELLRHLDGDIPDAPNPLVSGLNLFRHWSQHFLTSLWYPHPFNGFKVEEIFLRYGKSKAEMEAIDRRLGLPRLEYEGPDFGSFPAHAHISMGLAYTGFFYQVVIGPRAWPDYDQMFKVLRDRTRGPKLFDVFQGLQHNGYQIFFGDDVPELQSLAELVKHLIKYDHLRGESWFGLRKGIRIDGRLTVETEDLVSAIHILFPAFDLMAIREPGKG